MSRKDKTVSIALSEKRCCPPLFFDVRGFQDLMTDGDIQRVKEPRLQRDWLRFLPVWDPISSCTLDYDFFYAIPS